VRRKTGYDFVTVGTGATYETRAADRGQLLNCQALGSNGGGRTTTPFGPESSIRG
jgi:hypothetical protein